MYFPVESAQQCAGELLSSGRNMNRESVGIDESTEVPKSTNPYVKLLVRLYKFLARKYLRRVCVLKALTMTRPNRCALQQDGSATPHDVQDQPPP